MTMRPGAFFPLLEDRSMLHPKLGRRVIGSAFLMTVLLSPTLGAQASGTQSVTATVTAKVYAPLTIVKNDDLRFGSLYSPYAAKTILFTDNTSFIGRAKFTIGGEGGAEISMVVNVPSTLASGANTLPVGSFELRHHTSDTDAAGTDVALVSGNNTVTFNLTGAAGASGNRWVRVRATASPGGSQATGNYTANLVVTVNYTGA
jgi:hypothetical protein